MYLTRRQFERLECIADLLRLSGRNVFACEQLNKLLNELSVKHTESNAKIAARVAAKRKINPNYGRSKKKK